MTLLALRDVWLAELRRRAELSQAEIAEQADLGRRAWAASSEPDSRYPFGIVWSPPTWLALIRDPNGRLIGRAGVLERTVLWGGQPTKVGGLSSVSTDPDYRGQGVASAAVSSLTTFSCEELGARVGLLLASRMGQPVYKRLGWQVADGPLRCDQPDGPLIWTTAFPDKPAMAWTCTRSDLPAGPIDLQGLPW
jgi:GNAT superfamily N-acetyltransferase